jgi:3-oxoadipate enol-lactonase/4-carboxymuconolactone decarboxylase
MPFASRDAVRLYWRFDGEAHRPVLLLLHALGTDMSVWDRARGSLLAHFRVLCMDLRGHGASDAPGGEYRMEQLADDVLAVMQAAQVPQALVCGISLGGMVAMSLALRAPASVSGLVCACTSAQMDAASWAARIDTLRREGIAGVAAAVMQRFFAPEFAAQHPEICAGVRSTLDTMSVDGYVGCAAAIRDMQLIDRIGALTAPMLLIYGQRDVSTPWQGHGERIAAAVRNAHVEGLDTGHLACVESPQVFASLVWNFLRGANGADAAADARVPGAAGAAGSSADQSAPAREQQAAEVLFEAGLAIRRKVLGDAWVDRALASRTPFNADYQAMISRCAWHEIWGRPGLDHRTRRLLVLATTVALGRWEEFRLHVRAGLSQGGFSEQELREVLMQSAMYAGVPAANTAFMEAAAVMRELEGAHGP